jgi:hypothetical protein
MVNKPRPWGGILLVQHDAQALRDVIQHSDFLHIEEGSSRGSTAKGGAVEGCNM